MLCVELFAPPVGWLFPGFVSRDTPWRAWRLSHTDALVGLTPPGSVLTLRRSRMSSGLSGRRASGPLATLSGGLSARHTSDFIGPIFLKRNIFPRSRGRGGEAESEGGRPLGSAEEPEGPDCVSPSIFPGRSLTGPVLRGPAGPELLLRRRPSLQVGKTLSVACQGRAPWLSVDL